MINRKRVVCLIMAMTMVFLMFGCQKGDGSQVTTQATQSRPLVSGTFMQPGAFAGYTQDRMTKHLRYLKDVGIDLLIVQSTFDSDNKITKAYFESSFPEEAKADTFHDDAKGFLDVVLASAKACDMQVYVGLNNNGQWWNKVFADQAWLDDHVTTSLQAARQIYDGYKQRYPDTLTGWYFWPEYWNMDCNEQQTDVAARFISDYRDGLAAIDPNMPMLLSPFISRYGTSPEGTKKFWTDIFAKSTLRSGDIFCCQDSVGAGHTELDQLDAYFAAMKSAAETKDGIKFWANNEDFTPEFGSADMGRFLQQLEITHKYTDTHISFAFCHYRNPDIGKTKAYEAYRHYYQTGERIVAAVEAPQVTVESISQGLSIHFDICVDNSAGNVHSVVLTKDGEVLSQWVFDKDSHAQQLHVSYQDVNENAGPMECFFTIHAVDFYGNTSEPVIKKIPVFTKNMQ